MRTQPHTEWREKQWYVATMDDGFDWGKPHKRKRDAMNTIMRRTGTVSLRSLRKEYSIYLVWVPGDWQQYSHTFYVAPGHRLLDAGFSPKATDGKGRS